MSDTTELQNEVNNLKKEKEDLEKTRKLKEEKAELKKDLDNLKGYNQITKKEQSGILGLLGKIFNGLGRYGDNFGKNYINQKDRVE